MIIFRRCKASISRNDIDSTSIARQDNSSIIAAFKKDGIKCAISGDSLFISWTAKDTLFAISGENKLRSLKEIIFKIPGLMKVRTKYSA